MIGWVPKSRDPSVASVRYRCTIPIRGLNALGHQAELFDEARAASYDIVVFSKLYDPKNRHLAADLRRAGARVVLDLCDNHFYNPFGLPAYRRARSDMLAMIECVDDVVCSTDALADVVRREAGLDERPAVVGDPLDADGYDFAAPPEARARGARTLLWFGHHGSPNAPGGMDDLLRIGPLLEEVSTHHRVELLVVSNNRQKFDSLIGGLSLPARYAEWSRETFSRHLLAAVAALIPITSNPFNLCKSNNRLATALYASVPVVADAIPSYEPFRDCAFLDDWDAGLTGILSRDPDVAARTSKGRARVVEACSESAIAGAWADAFGLHRGGVSRNQFVG